jgi:hypothetical protein
MSSCVNFWLHRKLFSNVKGRQNLNELNELMAQTRKVVCEGLKLMMEQ